MISFKRVFPRFELGYTFQALSILCSTEEALKTVNCIMEFPRILIRVVYVYVN